MAFLHKVDWGDLSCVPLRTSDDPEHELPGVGWTVGGEATVAARIDILKRAKREGVTLDRLTRVLGVTWTHFEEWAEAYGQNTLLIFIEHLPWKDELLHEANGDLRKRLGVDARSFE